MKLFLPVYGINVEFFISVVYEFVPDVGRYITSARRAADESCAAGSCSVQYR